MEGPRSNLNLRPGMFVSKGLGVGRGRNAPFVEMCPFPWLDPYTIYPSTISSMHGQDPPFLGFIILYIGVQSRDALERAEVYVNLGGSG